VKKKYRLALALGGGGARGIAHIGVLKVLERENIIPDLIVGTSMGAIVGGMYCQLHNAGRLESRVLSFLDEFLEDKRWIRVMDQSDSEEKHSLFTELSIFVQRRILGLKALTRVSLESKEALYEPLKSVLIDNNIEDNKIPFAAVTIDILNGERLVLNSGSIIDAVYASAAIEGVFPPLEYDHRLLSDGGPINMTPVEIALQLGAEKVIAVDVSQPIRAMDKFANGIEVIMRADNISLDMLRQSELAKADIVIRPKVSSLHWASFGRARECISLGQLETAISIPDIKMMLAKRKWLLKIRRWLKSYEYEENQGL
jgi:NTE family protein